MSNYLSDRQTASCTQKVKADWTSPPLEQCFPFGSPWWDGGRNSLAHSSVLHRKLPICPQTRARFYCFGHFLGNGKYHCQFLPQEVWCLILIIFPELFRTTAFLITSANWRYQEGMPSWHLKGSKTADHSIPHPRVWINVKGRIIDFRNIL